jgi:hypothetical protein
MTTQITNNGLNALASQVQTLITYVAVGTGAGTLASGLTINNTYTSLTLATGVPALIPSGTSLTIINGSTTQTVTTSAVTAQGATTISVSSFTANATYPIGSGVVNTPSATDQTLQNEVHRVAATTGSAGANPGESLNPAYMDPTTPTGTYIEVGFFGGPTATSSANTGALIARGTCWWSHTQYSDSASLQLDSVV